MSDESFFAASKVTKEAEILQESFSLIFCRVKLLPDSKNIHIIPLARTRACQAVFVFSLHSFTRMPQVLVAQFVRGEGFSLFKFTAAIDGVHGG